MEAKPVGRKQRSIIFMSGIVCLLLVVAAGGYAAFRNSPQPSHAATGAWIENFDGNSLNNNFWNVSNEQYGMGAIDNQHQGYFQSKNVSVGGGYLTIALTQEKGRVGSNANGIISRGGEIESKTTYGYGTYEWRMRTSGTASSPTDTSGKVVSGQISSGFTYTNNSESELDFEVEGQYPKTAEMTTWHNTHPQTDPTEHDQIENDAQVEKMANEFKTYKVVWNAGEVTYYINDQQVAHHTSHVPSVAASVMINHWGTDSEEFGGLATVGTTRYLLVDWVRYTPPGETAPTPTPETTATTTAPTPTPVPPTPTPAQPTPTPGPTASNLIQGGSFENTSTLDPWYFTANYPAAGNATIDKTTYSSGHASARINITRADSRNSWNAQFGQSDVAFQKGHTYTITFSAKASAKRTGQLDIQLNARPWTEYLKQNFTLSTNWQQYSYTFTPSTNITNAEVNFNLGQSKGTVWIDNVAIH
jgi:hypothetical protein